MNSNTASGKESAPNIDYPWPPEAQAILDRLRAAKSVWITGHERPDMDCAGAEIALGGALKAIGKRVRIGNADPLPRRCLKLETDCDISPWHAAESLSGFDEILLLDASSAGRMGKIESADGWRAPLVIDHHILVEPYGEIAWVESRAAATSEMIYPFIRRLGVPIPPASATALLAGIMFDTGSFRYSSTRPVTFTIAAKLVEHGASPDTIHRINYLERSWGEIRLEAVARANLRPYFNGKIVVTHLDKKDFDETGGRPDETSEFPTMTREPAGNRVGVFISWIADNQTKVSLRSDGSVDVARVAGAFGGGGHRRAAGCRFPGKTPQEIETLIIEEVKKYL